MSTGSNFRHHATIWCMIFKLRQHNIRAYVTAAIGRSRDNGGCGLVAAGFNAQYGDISFGIAHKMRARVPVS
jgi:hypothetical protein